MFEYIRGELVQSEPLRVVVDHQGLGYAVQIPVNSYSKLPLQGEEVRLFLSFVIRDNDQTLYGFLTVHERNLFNILLGVSGIGPKMALGLIGYLEPEELAEAVTNDDVSLICRVPGIGKKTAQRLIIEVRDKLPSLCARDVSQATLVAPRDSRVQDAMSALVNLGYPQNKAQKALKQVLDEKNDLELPELITASLKKI